MEWIGPLLIAFLVVVGVLQLFWTYAISAITRKTDQSELMEVLAWIPLLQIGPMVRAGGGSIGRFVFGLVGLTLALVSLFAVASFLGNRLGPMIIGVGVGLATLFCLVYAGQLSWRTATARGLSGWVGLLVFVPIANLFAYPYIAFHDGLIRPNRLGLAIGSLLIVLSSAPSISSVKAVMQELEGLDAPSAARILSALTTADESGKTGLALDLQGDVDSQNSKAMGSDDESIRALYALKTQFDSLDSAADEDDSTNARVLVQTLRSQLESSRDRLDASTFGDLATHLLEVESRLRVEPEPATRKRRRDAPVAVQAPAAAAPLAWRTTADGSSKAATPSYDDSRLAPLRPLPVAIGDECLGDTVLKTARDERGEEEWCEQRGEAGGLRHGFYARYRLDGRPESMGEYRDGLRVGVWTRFHPTGGVRAQAEFREGLQHGWVLTFDESGRLKRSVRFEAGVASPTARPSS